MIVDLLTNSRSIFDFVKRKYGGKVIELKQKPFELVNIPIGFADDLKSELDALVEKEGIDLKKFGYRVIGPRDDIIEASAGKI